MCGCPCISLSVRFCFHSSASPFTQIEACVTPICDSSVCVFPPLFVLAGSCNQQHFCILKMGFGVEETFQRFFLTLTPMFSLHIKLLGGPPDCFLLTTLRKNAVVEITTQKMFCFVLSKPFWTTVERYPQWFWKPQVHLVCSPSGFFAHNTGDVALMSWDTSCGKPSGIKQPWWKIKLGVTTVATTT